MANLSLGTTYPIQQQPSTGTQSYLHSQINAPSPSPTPFAPPSPGITSMAPGFSPGPYPSTGMPIAPDMPMPTFGDVPAVDEARIKRLTQTRSAAGQRSLRSALRESLLQASYQDNPNVAAMIGKKALSGFGQGIAEVYEKAQKQATSEEYRNRQMQFAKQQAVFNAGMQDYLRRFGTSTTYGNQAGQSAIPNRLPGMGVYLAPGAGSPVTSPAWLNS